MKLREYQEKFINDISVNLTKHKRIIAQLSTGGGKTISFSAICDRYTKKSGKSVLILVHRKELLKQATESLRKFYGIYAQPIEAGIKYIPEAPVYVAMVETAYKRLKQFSNIGLVIIDECHLGNFSKIIDFYENNYIIGFTATPLAANKTNPLHKYFNAIVCGIDIPQLIKDGHLCQNITYAPAEVVEREKLKMNRGDFDENQMGQEFSKPKYIDNTVKAYERYSLNKKTIIFNCNVEHSKKVTEAFINSGYDCKHLDAQSKDRQSILEWFSITPKAILCNVGIATTGFDQPDIETVIVNKATASMPLWLQMCGRGGRLHEIKKMFTIIDMGGNTVTHNDWSVSRNWVEIFSKPYKKSREGAPPIKQCEKCGGFIHARKMICDLPNIDTGEICNYVFPEKTRFEAELNDFVIMTENIDVNKLIQENNHYKEYYSFYKIIKEVAKNAKSTIKSMTNEHLSVLLENTETLCKQWCKEKKKRFYQWHKDEIKSTLSTELLKLYPAWSE